MIKDRVAFDLPAYDGLLAGHYRRGRGYGRRRQGGTDDWLMILTVSGLGRVDTASGEVMATPASMILTAPGTTHDYGTHRESDHWEILWVHFQPPVEWLAYLDWPRVAAGVRMFQAAQIEPIESAFREVVSRSNEQNRRRRELSMNALERLLLLCEQDFPEVEVRLDERIKAVNDSIHRHLRDPITLKDLARVAGLSESRFSHLFRAEMGISPGEHVRMQRLERARLLLARTSLGIAEVAAEVGMEPFHLSASFRKVYGKSPRAFRTGLRN
jgi:AraC family transcriptional regulator of arabinose operon